MIIDAHTHLPGSAVDRNMGIYGTADAAVNSLRAGGVDAAFFNTWQGVFADSESDLDELKCAQNVWLDVSLIGKIGGRPVGFQVGVKGCPIEDEDPSIARKMA